MTLAFFTLLVDLINADHALIYAGLAQVTLLNQPQDATVRRGGDATFHCAEKENGTALLFVWYFTSVGGSRMSVGTGTPVAGVSRITVSGDRTQLTLSGVQREVDRATVVCSAIGSTVNVDSDPATLTVHCKWKHLWWKGETYHTIINSWRACAAGLVGWVGVQVRRSQPSPSAEGSVPPRTLTCRSGMQLWQLECTNYIVIHCTSDTKTKALQLLLT